VSEPTGPGMGRPSGPGFDGPPVAGAAPLGGPPLQSPRPASTPGAPVPAAPTPSRLPAVLTVLAVAVVVLIVTIASVVAAREDVRQATPPPTVAPAEPLPTDDHKIEFTTSTGSGVLEITAHGWDSDGRDTQQPGSLLTVAVRISCESGILTYGPDSFQAFDRSGELFEPEVVAGSSTALPSGTLSAGQQATGTVAFDISRGGVTLLMSEDSSRTVTALRVPD
jgi:hypothetical protein